MTIKRGLQDIPPVIFSGLRYFSASILLLALILLKKEERNHLTELASIEQSYLRILTENLNMDVAKTEFFEILKKVYSERNRDLLLVIRKYKELNKSIAKINTVIERDSEIVNEFVKDMDQLLEMMIKTINQAQTLLNG